MRLKLTYETNEDTTVGKNVFTCSTSLASDIGNRSLKRQEENQLAVKYSYDAVLSGLVGVDPAVEELKKKLNISRKRNQSCCGRKKQSKCSMQHEHNNAIPMSEVKIRDSKDRC